MSGPSAMGFSVGTLAAQRRGEVRPMAEVDRRGFFRILRRTDTAAAEPADPGAPSEKDLQVGQLADLTLRLLADVDAANAARPAAGTLLTVPCSPAAMWVPA